MAKTKVTKTKAKSETFRIRLVGYPPGLMFDRYAGDNSTQLDDPDKMYLGKGGQVYLPAENVRSFLSAENTLSAPKALYDPRKYKDKTRALRGYTIVTPEEILITRGGKPVKWLGDFDDDRHSGPSGIVLVKNTARLDKGIPNPKSRPVVVAPWEAEFQIELFENKWVKPADLRFIMEHGMLLVGLGTYRGVFGKAAVEWL